MFRLGNVNGLEVDKKRRDKCTFKSSIPRLNRCQQNKKGGVDFEPYPRKHHLKTPNIQIHVRFYSHRREMVLFNQENAKGLFNTQRKGPV